MHLLIADDCPDFAHTLAELLSGEPGVDSIDLALTGSQAVEMAAVRWPDLAILDIEMPGFSGPDAARAIQQASLGRTAMVVAMTGNPDSALAAVLAGVFTIVLSKPVPYERFLVCVRSAGDHSQRLNGTVHPGPDCAEQPPV